MTGERPNGDKRPEKPRPPIKSGKLTKRFFLELKEGLYLVSNIQDGTTRETATPVFAEAVAATEQRDAQRQKIKDLHADGRLCDLFESPVHHSSWKQYWIAADKPETGPEPA